jgi:hypothetical protein
VLNTPKAQIIKQASRSPAEAQQTNAPANKPKEEDAS